MSIESAIARIAELRGGAAPVPVPAPAAGATPMPASASASGLPFSALLQRASTASAPAGAVPAMDGGGIRAAIVAAAQGEVGQAEQPPGSNDSPRIAGYRAATAGSGIGPWCGYFVSWAASQAGVPLGEQGQGFGSVDALYAWAQRTGRAVPATAGQPPQPGDLVVWDEHIGIVESVLPDGSVQTIEGNSSDQVARRVHPPGDALGYVRMS